MAKWYCRFGSGGHFSRFDPKTERDLEFAFVAAAGKKAVIEKMSLTSFPLASLSFDMDMMTLSDNPLRRIGLAPHSGLSVFFWDDKTWSKVDDAYADLVLTCSQLKRELTVYHTDDSTPYKLSFTPHLVQANMITGYARPLKIVGVPSIPIADEEMLSFDDDPLCPNEFKCPITTQIMTTPVVMADGVSYEYRAISKWIAKKEVSPVTGQPLATTAMFPNFALKALIRDSKAANDDDTDGKPPKRQKYD